MFLRNFGQDLNEIERPVFPGILLGVGEPVEPGLELIQKEHHRGVMEELKYQLI